MQVLFIGGTGNISTAVSRLFLEKDIDLFHLNRGNQLPLKGVNQITTDINNTFETEKLLQNYSWDAVVNWIAFTPADIQRDFKLFQGRTKQYIFVSSASAYHKPSYNHIITESSPLKNIYWEYSRNKIACEELLMSLYREKNFPVTIVRPSYTYDTIFPLSIGGGNEYTVIDRMKKGKPIVIHGDGTSLWTNTHAIDFAGGFIGLTGNKFAIGESFHITSDEVLSWDEIYQSLANAAGCEAKIVHIPSDYISDFADKNNFPSMRGTLLGDKSHSSIFDNSKIKRFVPGFKADISFSEGIKKTLDWFEKDFSRMIINQETNLFIDGLIEKYGK